MGSLFSLIPRSRKTYYLILGITAVVLIIYICTLFLRSISLPNDDHISIILSPHYDDAVLSLGGFIAKHEHPVVVATFFTAGPAIATTTDWDKNSGFTSSLEVSSARTKENANALRFLKATPINYFYQDFQYRNGTSSDPELRREIAKDIQSLLASYENKTIDVYGPSIFTEDINHPDHALLHQAFVDVERDYPNNNVRFYFYEDYPYVERFMKSATSSLERNLEKDTGQIFTMTRLILGSSDLAFKKKALQMYSSQIKAFTKLGEEVVTQDITYTSKRCGTACEVVYKVFRVSE